MVTARSIVVGPGLYPIFYAQAKGGRVDQFVSTLEPRASRLAPVSLLTRVDSGLNDAGSTEARGSLKQLTGLPLIGELAVRLRKGLLTAPKNR
jgi:hypothetical protein